ncbi:MAG: ABC transporter permease subunit [Chloroflexi bacterium]|nr:ABC transporter permease subunit [Chloroflexota bacterium]
MKSIVVARLTVGEAARRRMLLAALLLSAVFLVVYALGLHYGLRDFEVRAARRPVSEQFMTFFIGQTVLAGLYVVSFLAGLIAIFMSVGTISGEIDAGTLHTLVAKPLRRWEIVIGKWLGYLALLFCYTAIMAFGVLVIAYVRSGYWPPATLPGLGSLLLGPVLLLSLSLAGSTILPTLANGVVAFSLYGVALIGGFVEQIGSLAENRTMENIGVAASLVIPSDSLWKLAAHLLQPPRGLVGIPSPFAPASPPSTLLVGYALLYIGFALATAVAVFSKRDL